MDRFTTSALALIVGLILIVLGIADAAGNSGVSLVVGGALVVAPLVASLADRRCNERPAR
jgi:hypothetical protein